MVGICQSFQNSRDRGRRINQKFKAILEYKEVQGQLSYKGTWVFLLVWLIWLLFCFVFKGGRAKENRKEKILNPSFLFWKCFEFYNYLHKFNTHSCKTIRIQMSHIHLGWCHIGPSVGQRLGQDTQSSLSSHSLRSPLTGCDMLDKVTFPNGIYLIQKKESM